MSRDDYIKPQRGVMGQTAILNYLVQHGYEVLLPWGDYHRYDIAIFLPAKRNLLFGGREAQLIRFQCKTAWLYGDGAGIEFPTVSTHLRVGGGHKRTGYVGDAEYFAVYSPDTGKVYFIEVDEVAASPRVRLRLKKLKNNQEQGVRWAKDYEGVF